MTTLKWFNKLFAIRTKRWAKCNLNLNWWKYISIKMDKIAKNYSKNIKIWKVWSRG